ncbi:MAG: baseplate J/gp47 family protein [Thiobacillus sp.]
MSITIRSTKQLVQGYAAQVQGATSSAISFVLGSLELARANAVAGVVMWLQSKVMQVLALTRASTSTGTDLDSWMADYGIVTREAAVSATGSATLSRYTTTAQATVYPGALLKTADGTQTFTVIADTSQSAWNPTLSAYIVPIGTASATVTVQAVTAGTAGNINANTLTQIASSMPGVDTANNAAAYANGVNAESDAALLVRFQLALQGLRSGIKSSATAAIEALQQNIQSSIVENQTLAGATQNGFFYVIISPFNSTLQSQVYSAVDAVRPLSVTFAVYGATTATANITFTLTVLAGYTHTQVAAAITTALQNFIAAIPLGAGLSYSQLYSVIWGVSGVSDATGLTLNGGTSDIAANAQTQVIAGTITVN